MRTDELTEVATALDCFRHYAGLARMYHLCGLYEQAERYHIKASAALALLKFQIEWAVE